MSSLAGLSLGRHVLVDGLGALGDGVLGELAGQDQPHGGLDVAGGETDELGALVQLRRLGRDPLEHIHAHAVHDLQDGKEDLVH